MNHPKDIQRYLKYIKPQNFVKMTQNSILSVGVDKQYSDQIKFSTMKQSNLASKFSLCESSFSRNHFNKMVEDVKNQEKYVVRAWQQYQPTIFIFVLPLNYFPSNIIYQLKIQQTFKKKIQKQKKKEQKGEKEQNKKQKQSKQFKNNNIKENLQSILIQMFKDQISRYTNQINQYLQSVQYANHKKIGYGQMVDQSQQKKEIVINQNLMDKSMLKQVFKKKQNNSYQKMDEEYTIKQGIYDEQKMDEEQIIEQEQKMDELSKINNSEKSHIILNQSFRQQIKNLQDKIKKLQNLKLNKNQQQKLSLLKTIQHCFTQLNKLSILQQEKFFQRKGNDKICKGPKNKLYYEYQKTVQIIIIVKSMVEICKLSMIDNFITNHNLYEKINSNEKYVQHTKQQMLQLIPTVLRMIDMDLNNKNDLKQIDNQLTSIKPKDNQTIQFISKIAQSQNFDDILIFQEITYQAPKIQTNKDLKIQKVEDPFVIYKNYRQKNNQKLTNKIIPQKKEQVQHIQSLQDQQIYSSSFNDKVLQNPYIYQSIYEKQQIPINSRNENAVYGSIDAFNVDDESIKNRQLGTQEKQDIHKKIKKLQKPQFQDQVDNLINYNLLDQLQGDKYLRRYKHLQSKLKEELTADGIKQILSSSDIADNKQTSIFDSSINQQNYQIVYQVPLSYQSNHHIEN